jgi:hypothetical protein
MLVSSTAKAGHQEASMKFVIATVATITLLFPALADSVSDMAEKSVQLQQAMDDKTRSETQTSNAIRAVSKAQRTIVANVK